jgi:hypothetical protein
MAIDTWIQVTLDPAASDKADRADTVVGGTADTANQFQLAFDSAVITNVTLMKSCMDAAYQRALGILPQ